jgi:hypothetical protein
VLRNTKILKGPVSQKFFTSCFFMKIPSPPP